MRGDTPHGQTKKVAHRNGISSGLGPDAVALQPGDLTIMSHR